MANPKIFVSSTCFDLNVVRSQLRGFITSFGYEPVMSDYADVLYDPRSHTHANCLKEVENCDMLIVIIGSRFGGRAIPEAIEDFDFDLVRNLSKSVDLIEKEKSNLSITQLEVLNAISNEIPIFTFVEDNVNYDHLVYEKNKDKDILKSITFPSISKPETAVYIFEFINFLRHRNENNSIATFSRMDDIELYLKKQWAGLFQRLLNEQKGKQLDERKMDYLTTQITDIKTAIMTSISSNDLKETAKGAFKYRRLIEFLFYISFKNKNVLLQNISWEDMLKSLNVKDIVKPEDRREIIVVLENDTYFETRVPSRIYEDFKYLWEDFTQLGEQSKKAVMDAILDDTTSFFRLIRHHDIPYKEESEEKEDTQRSSQQEELVYKKTL